MPCLMITLFKHQALIYAEEISILQALQYETNYHECLVRTQSMSKDVASGIVTHKIAYEEIESFDKKTR